MSSSQSAACVSKHFVFLITNTSTRLYFISTNFRNVQFSQRPIFVSSNRRRPVIARPIFFRPIFVDFTCTFIHSVSFYHNRYSRELFISIHLYIWIPHREKMIVDILHAFVLFRHHRTLILPPLIQYINVYPCFKSYGLFLCTD